MTLKEIHATQQIMRIAINGQNHVDSLIGYYRDCIDKFNDERAQWSLHYQICKDNVSNRHVLERQLAKINGANVDLQNLLSGLKGDLTYERQKYFQRIEQNQRIKKTLQQNKKRLRELTEICKPLMSNVHNKSTNSIKTTHEPFFKNEKLSNRHEELQTKLQMNLINLSREHQKKKTKLQKEIEELKDELEDIVGEHAGRREKCSQQYKVALDKLSDLEGKYHNLVTEFFRYRMNGIEDEQRIQQENQLIRLKNLALAQKLKQLQESHQDEYDAVQSEVKRKNKQFKQKYDEELRKKQQHLSILKQQHERISDIYLNKLKKLQNELRVTTEKTRTIQEKTKTEVSSLKSQIKILTNRLENVAMNHMKSDLVANNEEQSEEDSSVTLEMEELDRINKEVKELEKELDGKKKDGGSGKKDRKQ